MIYYSGYNNIINYINSKILMFANTTGINVEDNIIF